MGENNDTFSVAEAKGFEAVESSEEVKAKLRALYGVNKRITDGSYDKSLAVKCINGTFVGKGVAALRS